jgi:peptide/nickel transport system substrate-binding protein
MKKRRLIVSAAAAVVVALAMTGCVKNANSGGSSTGAAKAADHTLTVAYSEGGQTLDPAEADDQTSDTLVVAAYDQLVTYGTTMKDGKRVSDTSKIVPMLATKWTTNSDKTEYTFTLRQGVKFQDGKTMTSEDVVKTFQYIAASADGSFLYQMAGIKSVTAPTSDTVDITLTAPNHLFMQIIPMYTFSIIDMDKVDANGGAGWLATHTAGTGPYVVDNWDPANSAKLTAYAGYWGAKPALSTVNLQFVSSDSSRIQLLQKGSVDMSLALQPSELSTLKGDKSIAIDSRASNEILFFAMNTDIAPFNNVKVRQAITYAIDYNELIKNVMAGQATRMESAVPDTMPGWTDAGYTAKYDLAKAKELLKEAGYPDGFSFNFTLGSGFSDWNDDAVMIQASLAKIGVKMNIQNMARAQFLTALANKNVQAYISRWTSFVNDPGYHLGLLLTTGASSNYNNFSNAQVDALWKQASTEQSASARTKNYQAMQKIINEQAPWAYLYQYNNVIVMRSDVQGYTSYPDNLIRFFQLSKKS